MTDDLKKRVEETLKLSSLFPFEIAQGDAMMRTNPHSNVCLNSTASWLVSANIKSAAKLRIGLETFNAIPDVIKALTEREAALVALLQECKYFLPEYDECKPRLGSNNKLYILHKEIDATLSQLGLEG